MVLFLGKMKSTWAVMIDEDPGLEKRTARSRGETILTVIVTMVKQIWLSTIGSLD
jgi:hypothetical protein